MRTIGTWIMPEMGVVPEGQLLLIQNPAAEEDCNSAPTLRNLDMKLLHASSWSPSPNGGERNQKPLTVAQLLATPDEEEVDIPIETDDLDMLQCQTNWCIAAWLCR